MDVKRNERLPRELPVGLDDRQAKAEGWSFLPGPNNWRPPEGYDEETVCREILEEIRATGKIPQAGAYICPSSNKDGKYYAFTAQQFLDKLAPKDRAEVRRLLEKEGFKFPLP